MARCPACSREVPEGSRVCPSCAVPLVPDAVAPTKTFAAIQARPPLSPFPVPKDAARFVPGQVLAGRYRVVALLGQGGMGEVYRADDLALGQSVALKFLPAKLLSDPERLARFRGEVRVARQVSHPNVCRVYDIAEHEGQPFLTMEFIDGQDLAALLKQVGRLPEERAIELARQMCLGLAAVHDREVLHRDLKPHNVMIDGRGQVRLTDFGLAIPTPEHDGGPDEIAGTPGYMAPEQLAGKGVSIQSDLYSLGLVLYELITGKRPFAATTPQELRRLHAEAVTPAKPSSHVSGLNPAIETAIVHCLERNPSDRPRSAYEVLAALPGGDPLAAALAAGQTPSPKMVADAPVEGVLPPWISLTLVAATLLVLVAAAVLHDYAKLFRYVPLELPPQELTLRARAVTRQLGYTDPPLDSAIGMAEHVDSLEFLRKGDALTKDWERLRTGQPALMFFWYRQSPERLVSTDANWMLGFGLVPGQIHAYSPPTIMPGMVTVCLDLKGRLIEFRAVPPLVAADNRGAGGSPAAMASGPPAPRKSEPAPDWQALFKEAGLDLSRFTPAPSYWNPPVHSDARMAWRGVYSERPEIPIHVEVAAYRGRPVFFHVGPRDRADGLYTSRPPMPAEMQLFQPVLIAIVILMFTGGAWLARRNLRLGRANPKGALRLAAFQLVAYLFYWLLVAKHVFDFGTEIVLFSAMAGLAGLTAVELWLAYLALEPYVRRHWPWWVVSWNRLLDGRWRDPLVGRDVLIGGLFGVVAMLLMALPPLVARADGSAPPPQALPFVDTFTSSKLMPVSLGLVTAALPAMTDFFLLFVLFLLLRRRWLAFAAFFLIQWIPGLLVAESSFFREGIAFAVWHAMWLFVLWRFGFLPYAVGVFVYFTLLWLPLSTELTAWYTGQSVVAVLVVVGLACYAFVISLGGRPLLPKGFFGDE